MEETIITWLRKAIRCNMQENPPAGHTLAEHREYLHEIVRLQLFFLHGYCREHPEEAFRDVLESRVDIYRKTDANPGPADPAECFFDREHAGRRRSRAGVDIRPVPGAGGDALRGRGDRAR